MPALNILTEHVPRFNAPHGIAEDELSISVRLWRWR
jgi:hypothetical protein